VNMVMAVSGISITMGMVSPIMEATIITTAAAVGCAISYPGGMIEELEEYLEQLKAEVQGVEERLAELKK